MPFYAERVQGYCDWGTIHEWRKFLQSHTCVFVSLDGFAFERGHLHFEPTFANVKPTPNAVKALKQLASHGSRMIYLSIRPNSFAEVTRQQMKDADLPEGEVEFGCLNTRWKFVSAPHPVLPLTTFAGIEVVPDSDGLYEKIISA